MLHISWKVLLGFRFLKLNMEFLVQEKPNNPCDVQELFKSYQYVMLIGISKGGTEKLTMQKHDL